MSNQKTIAEYLITQGELTYFFHGVSMEPLLRQERHDLVTLRKKLPGERCQKYDVALYHLPQSPGRYVMHRIIAVTPEGYTFLGDNCIHFERNIREEDVVGVLTAFHRRGVTTPVTATWYKVFSRIWWWLFPLRYLYKRLRGLAGRIYRCLCK